MDVLGNIIAYEEGTLSEEECITLFSQLIKSGQCWSLQGHYGRTANSLIANNIIDSKGNILAL